jgi:hypothetical protein
MPFDRKRATSLFLLFLLYVFCQGSHPSPLCHNITESAELEPDLWKRKKIRRRSGASGALSFISGRKYHFRDILNMGK